MKTGFSDVFSTLMCKQTYDKVYLKMVGRVPSDIYDVYHTKESSEHLSSTCSKLDNTRISFRFFGIYNNHMTPFVLAIYLILSS